MTPDADTPPPEKYRERRVAPSGLCQNGTLRRTIAGIPLFLVLSALAERSLICQSLHSRCVVCACNVVAETRFVELPGTNLRLTLGSPTTTLLTAPSAAANWTLAGHEHLGPFTARTQRRGWLVSRNDGCGNMSEGRSGSVGGFARRINDDSEFAAFVGAAVAHREVSRADVGSAVETVWNLQQDALVVGNQPADLRVLDLANALYAKYKGKDVADVDLWAEHTRR